MSTRTRRTLTCGAVFAVAALAASIVSAQGRGGRGGAPAAPPTPVDPHDLSGFWELPPDGRNVPTANLVPTMTKRVLDRSMAHDAKAVRWCNTIGVPALMGLTRPFDIRQNDQFMVMVPEHVVASNRWIYLNRAKHIDPEIFEPNTNGDSIGHWEGDVLVVDTVGFDADHGLLTIPGGGVRTERSHLVERFRLVKNGAILSVVSTWTDPKVFRTPHTYEYRYNRLPRDYEARPSVGCDAYDEERGRFLTEPPQVPH